MNFDPLFLYQRCNCVNGKKISLRRGRKSHPERLAIYTNDGEKVRAQNIADAPIARQALKRVVQGD